MVESKNLFEVRHAANGARGAFVIERDGRRVAEMVYSRAGAKRAIIEHTEVDESLRGQGAGMRLLEALVSWARVERLSIFPVCPFAKAMFERTPALRDVLA